MADGISPSPAVMERKLGRADRIGPVDKAPLQDVFNLDEYMQNRVDERGGHKFPLEGLINEAQAGLPAGWEGTLANSLRSILPRAEQLAALLKNGVGRAPEVLPPSQTIEGAKAMSQELLGGYDNILKELG